MNLNGKEYFYIRNVQNDVIGLHDSEGKVVVNYSYDTWGNIVSITGSLKDSVGKKNLYRYRGYRYDEDTGMYYLQSRYYNPEWGRFINSDALIGQPGDLLSFNMFGYCHNNPVNMSDGSGYWPKWLKKAAKAVKKAVNKVVSSVKKAVKYVAKVAVISVVTRTNPVAAMNYVRNTQVDKNQRTTTQNRLINDQNDTSGTGGNFRYGLYSASNNACETIAVHNAKVLKGINSNLSSTMMSFQMANAMIEPTGYFGSNPYSIGRVLSNSGISYSRVGLNEMTEPGTYIISYWNGTPCMSSHCTQLLLSIMEFHILHII